jgi:hypothetical protein
MAARVRSKPLLAGYSANETSPLAQVDAVLNPDVWPRLPRPLVAEQEMNRGLPGAG